MNVPALLSRLEDGLRTCEAAELRGALFSIEDELLSVSAYPEELFSGLLHVIGGGTYAQCKRGWLVLQHIYDQAPMLSPDQLSRLAPALADRFHGTGEKEAFTVALLLAEVCRDRSALEQLGRVHASSPFADIVADFLRRFPR